MAHDVFISYSQPDRQSALAICHHLEQAGVRCWMAPRDVPPGADWTDSIAAAVDQARALLVLFSAESARSRHVKSEVRAAFDRGKILVPVRVSDVQPDGGFDHLLGTSHWVNAFPQPLEEYFGEVSQMLRRILGQSTGDSPQVESATTTSPVGTLAQHNVSLADSPRWSRPTLIAVMIGLLASLVGAAVYFGSMPGDQPATQQGAGQPQSGHHAEKPGNSAEQVTTDEKTGTPANPLSPTESFGVAYVIANYEYPAHPGMNLIGAQEDGVAVRDALKAIGYRVVLLENASNAELRSMLKTLLSLEGEGGSFFVYYSGNAILKNGETYIVPADLPANESSSDVPATGVSTAELMAAAEGAEVGILYSAQSGAVAYDQAPGRKTSPFATAFIDNLNRGYDVVRLAEVVSRSVVAITGGKQEPELILDSPALAENTEPASGAPKLKHFVFFDGCRIEAEEKSAEELR